MIRKGRTTQEKISEKQRSLLIFCVWEMVKRYVFPGFAIITPQKNCLLTLHHQGFDNTWQSLGLIAYHVTVVAYDGGPGPGPLNNQMFQLSHGPKNPGSPTFHWILVG